MAMTVENIRELIKTNRIDKFYNSKAWRKKSHEVKAKQNNECQFCKARGRYTPALIVHHVKHLKDYPELAFSDYYFDEYGIKHKQLVACCHACHEEQHQRSGKSCNKEHFRNKEQW